MTKKKIIEIIAAIVVVLAAAFVPGLFGDSSPEIKNYDIPQYEYNEIAEEPEAELPEDITLEEEAPAEAPKTAIDEDGSYSTPEEVALYIHTYNKLPGNYISKTQAQKKGWKSLSYDLWEIESLKGKSIGGGPFGNREGILPAAEGREYYECDVNYYGGERGEERIVYSNDGLIFYTNDHYESYTQLY